MSSKNFTKALQKKTAMKHIENLFQQQNEVITKDISLAQRYSDTIRKLAMSFRIRLPREIKRSYCKHCYAIKTPENTRTRLKGSKLTIFCKNCNKFTRIPYK